MSKRPNLETILKVSFSHEREESIQEPTPQEILRGQSLEHTIVLEGIQEVDEQQARKLWEDVHRKIVENWFDNNVSPRVSKMNLEQ